MTPREAAARWFEERLSRPIDAEEVEHADLSSMCSVPLPSSDGLCLDARDHTGPHGAFLYADSHGDFWRLKLDIKR
jgi:hypothetical protein